LLHYKAGFEERALDARFDGYADYAARTPRLVPRVPTLSSVRGRR
jgi:protein-S-isoprenylcysteine O-methyltransferase Ste14